MTPSRPQFGPGAPGRAFERRPGAHGVLIDGNGLLAVVVIAPEGIVDLPGGALDHGETARQAVEREFREETGLDVRAGEEIARAAQFAHLDDGRAVNKDCVYFLVREVGARAAPTEPGHALAWRTPEEALLTMRHDAHAWALCAWMRASRRSGFA